MPFFSRRIPFDRKRLLDQADAATKRKRYRKAVVLYRQVLAAEPRNAGLHSRIAPLLARTGSPFEAWESYRIASEAPEIADDPQHLAKLFGGAARALPQSLDAWRALASARLRCQQPEPALEALLEGRAAFRKRRTTSMAIVLLRDAHAIRPWDPKIMLDLCRLLSRRGQSAEALYLLEELERRSNDTQVREIKKLVWRIDPTLGNTWRWLRSGPSASSKSRSSGRRARSRA